MSATLLIGLALAIAQPDQLPRFPIPDDAPKGGAPTLAYVTQQDGRILRLAYEYVQKSAIKTVEEKTADGKTVTKQVPVTYTEAVAVMRSVSEDQIKVKELDGTAVSYADAAKKLQGGAVVVVTYPFDAKSNALFLKVIKEGTLVIEMQPSLAPKVMPTPQKDAPKKVIPKP